MRLTLTGEPVSEYAPSVRDALAEFIDDLRLQGRDGTARSYVRQLADLVRLELDSVALLTPPVCRALLAEQVRRNSLSTASTFYAVLRSFCRYSVEHHYLATNPTDGLPKPKQRRPAHRWLTASQLRALFDACRTDTERLVLLLCGGSGLRAQELLTLKWSGVDFARGEIRVLGKGMKFRTLAPGRLAMGQLAELVKSPISPYVMPYRTNDTLHYHVERLGRRAGVGHVHPHMLRHSFAMAWIERTDDVNTLQQLLGHSSPQMSLYYARSAMAASALRRQAAVGLADGLFGAADP